MQTQRAEALPAPWVNRIFDEMRANYGAAFDRQWAHSDPAQAAKQAAAMHETWAKKLAGLVRHPEAIRYALDNLPSFPPGLPEFCSACNRAPTEQPPALPMPNADPERVAQGLEKLGKLHPHFDASTRAWARLLSAREEGGERLTLFQRSAWREALAAQGGSS